MKRIRWLLAGALVPKPLFACDGAGAMEIIVANERLGWMLWLASTVIAGAFAIHLRSRGWRKQWPLAAVVFVHPGWWLSARSGDCGMTLRDGSIVMTVVTLVVGCVMWWRARHAATN